MIHFVISGTINGEYDFPNDLFANFCYESWGNAWSLIDGVTAKYIPATELIQNPRRFDDFDILMAEFGQKELFDEASRHKHVFRIATQSGAGFDIDRENSGVQKLNFVNRLNEKCDLFLSTTYAGKEYFQMFTPTPILEIPLPIDIYKFRPREAQKRDKFTVCIGEIIESCYDDRPLQIEAAAIARSLGIEVVATIAPHIRNFNEIELNRLVSGIEILPFRSLYDMSTTYLADSHVSMMLGQRSTFGRFVCVSWAVGVPCIATRYQCQEAICPELTVSCEEIERIKKLLLRLRDDMDFYQRVRRRGLENMRKMSNENTALRIVNEILPIYFKARK